MAGTEAKAFSGTEQEATALQDVAQSAGTKDGPSQPGKRKAYAFGSTAKTEHQRRA